MIKKLSLLLWLCFLGTLLFAQVETTTDSTQVKKKKNDIIMGVGITGTGYYGDLNYTPEGILASDFFSFYPGFNFVLRPEAPKRLLPMLNLGYGKFISQNPDLEPVLYQITSPEVKDTLIQPNKFAETQMVYGDLGIHINLIRKFVPVRPHLGIGFGIVAFFPKSSDGIPLVRKKSSRAPSERTFEAITFSVPLTAGVDINLGKRVGLNVSYTYRIVTTDYLDNISELGRQSGNDKLHSIRLGANFRIFGEPQEFIVPIPPVADTMQAVIAAVDTSFIPDTGDCDELAAKYEARLAEIRKEKNRWEADYKGVAPELATQYELNDSLRWALTRKEVDLTGATSLNSQLQGELKMVKQTLTAVKARQGSDSTNVVAAFTQAELNRAISENIVLLASNDSLIFDLNLSKKELESMKGAIVANQGKDMEEFLAMKEENETLLASNKALIFDVNSLKLANSSMQEQLEDNLNFVKVNVKEKEKLELALIAEKSRTLYFKAFADSALLTSSSQNVDNTVLVQKVDKSRDRVQELIATLTQLKQEKNTDQSRLTRIGDSLKFEVALLESNLSAIKRNQDIGTSVSDRAAEKERILDELQSKLNIQERLLKQREASLASRAEEIKTKEERFLSLDDKEKELKLLEQQLKEIQANSGQATPATTSTIAAGPNSSLQVPAFLAVARVDKEVVKERIINYFSIRGYEYTIENGKIVYRNVVVPDVSNVAYDVTFYLVRSSYGRRQLVSTFKAVKGGYLSETLNPVESQNAKIFIGNLAN